MLTPSKIPLRERKMLRRSCLVLCINGEYRVFLVNVMAASEKLEELLPNFIVPRACFGQCRLCAADEILYIFCVSSPWSCRLEVYKVHLPLFFNVYYVNLDKNMGIVEKTTPTLSSKSFLQAIPFLIHGQRTALIIFSTKILFCDRDRTDGTEINDFEVYDPLGFLSRKLSQLLVRPKSRSQIRNRPRLSRSFLLLRHSSPSQEFIPTKHISDDYSFHITSFGLDVNHLFIQTDFGTTFSLCLNDVDDEWMVCDEALNFPSEMNFVTENGLLINSYGINGLGENLKFWPPWDAPAKKKYQVRRFADFPTSWIDGLERDGASPNAMAFLANNRSSCISVVSQIGLEAPPMESWKKMICFLDLFVIDLHQFSVRANEDKFEDDDEEYDANKIDENFEMTDYTDLVKKIKSIKFCLGNDERVLSAAVMAIYPF